jgi:hypothetical protein
LRREQGRIARVDDSPSARPRIPALVLATAVLLFVAALAVRGLAPKKVILPRDVPIDERPKLRDPLQLLGPAAGLRARELDELVSPAQRATFAELRTKLFALADCPELLAWCNSPEGQRLERLLNDLRAGTKEDAFAGLTLLFPPRARLRMEARAARQDRQRREARHAAPGLAARLGRERREGRAALGCGALGQPGLRPRDARRLEGADRRQQRRALRARAGLPR